MNGAPVLKERILNIAHVVFINAHFGIAPDYRGVNTIFWPLNRGDCDKLGITLHYIDHCIDGGAILGQGYASLDTADTEAAIIAKCIVLAIDIFLNFVEVRDKGPAAGHISMDKDELFKQHDR